MTVIDLGELRDDVEPDPPPRRPRATGRPFRSTLVLLLALATLAAGAPAPWRISATMPARSGSDAFLSGDRLYVVEPVSTEPGGPRQLTAYPLPDRAAPRPVRSTPLWRAQVPDGGQFVGVFALGDVVVVTGPSSVDGDFRTLAFDARTGQSLWRQPGVPIATSGGGLLLGQQGASVERSVEPRSGRTRWSAPVALDGVALRYRQGGVDRMVSAANSGQVDVWDATTGAKLRSTNVRPGELPTWQRAQVVDDLLLLVGSNATTVTAYGLDRLDRRWEARLSLVAYLDRCGDLLCAYGQTGGVWAVDPTTGRTRWSKPPTQAVLAERAGRLLASAEGSPAGDRLVVLEPPTGRVLAELGTWQMARPTVADSRLLGLRRSRDGRLLVAELDVAAGRTRMLDALPDVSGECQVDATTVVCRRLDGSFGSWRLDP